VIVVDTLTSIQRRRCMAHVRREGTTPERTVRTTLHRLGIRFRLHRRDLPGKPDLVLPRHRIVVFVHGCFWHGHKGCARSARPATNVQFWNRKLDGNARRDARVQKELGNLGWRVVVLWECRIRDSAALAKDVSRIVRPSSVVANRRDPGHQARSRDRQGCSGRGLSVVAIR
jgi:DNA mismatch endonuclease (patch repair protein)